MLSGVYSEIAAASLSVSSHDAMLVDDEVIKPGLLLLENLALETDECRRKPCTNYLALRSVCPFS